MNLLSKAYLLFRIETDPNGYENNAIYNGIHKVINKKYISINFRPIVKFAYDSERTIVHLKEDAIWSKATSWHPWNTEWAQFLLFAKADNKAHITDVLTHTSVIPTIQTICRMYQKWEQRRDSSNDNCSLNIAEVSAIYAEFCQCQLFRLFWLAESNRRCSHEISLVRSAAAMYVNEAKWSKFVCPSPFQMVYCRKIELNLKALNAETIKHNFKTTKRPSKHIRDERFVTDAAPCSCSCTVRHVLFNAEIHNYTQRCLSPKVALCLRDRSFCGKRTAVCLSKLAEHQCFHEKTNEWQIIIDSQFE